MQTIVILKDLTCYSCITHFAMDEALYRRRLEDGGSFWCPNGHSQHFTESEVQKLKRENQALKRDEAWAQQLLAKEQELHAETKSKLRKTNRRIANGVCPCCHRNFVNVARHMGSKHPDFKKVVS